MKELEVGCAELSSRSQKTATTRRFATSAKYDGLVDPIALKYGGLIYPLSGRFVGSEMIIYDCPMIEVVEGTTLVLCLIVLKPTRFVAAVMCTSDL